MAFQLYPSVEIRERNVSFNVANLPTSKTGMVLHCDTGPAYQITAITKPSELEDTFGEPTNYNYRDWYNAWNFLQYASSLHIVRPIDSAKATQNVGLGLTGGYGGGIVTATAAYQVASCGSALAADSSGLVNSTTYYFKVNDVQYNIEAGPTLTNTGVATEIDAALEAAGISCSYDDTLGGYKFIHDTVGEDYSITLATGTTSPDLFTALDDYDQFDPSVAGVGMTSLSPSGAYQTASMGTDTGVTASGLSGTTTYYFVINDVEYNITTAAALTHADITTLIDTAISAAGLTCTFDNGYVITQDTKGTAYSVELDHGTTGDDLWSTCTNFDGFDTAVAGVGPGKAMTTDSKLDLGSLYNDEIAEVTLDSRTASTRLEVYWRWVTNDASNYGLAVCSDVNSWNQPCAINVDANDTALFENFKDYFEFAPNFDSNEFAYIVFKEEDDGTFTAVEKKVVSYLSTGKDVFGSNIFAEQITFTSSNYIYMKVGSAGSYDDVNTGGQELPMFVQPNPGVSDVTIGSGGTGYNEGDTLVFTNDPDDTTGYGAAGYIGETGGVIDTINITNAGYGYTKVPTVTVKSGGGASASLTAVMTNLPAGTDPTCIYPVDGGATIQAYTGFASDYAVGDIEAAFDLFDDPDTFDINILLAHERSLFKASEIATSRKDCVALAGVVTSSDVVGKTSTQATTNIVETFGFDGVTPSPLPSYNTYCAHYGNMKYQYDKYADTNRWIPVIGDVAGLMAVTDTDYDPWWATAGMNRGVMRNVIKLAFNPNRENKKTLYSNSINPVVTIPGEGAGIIMGQKTATSVASAMNRLNVRRLLITVEKAVATALRPFIFEFNDEGTRSNILGVLNPYMEQIKSRRGVYEYLVVCDDSNNTSEVIDENGLLVNIFVKPTKISEFIQVNMIVTKTGANFDEVAF